MHIPLKERKKKNKEDNQPIQKNASPDLDSILSSVRISYNDKVQ